MSENNSADARDKLCDMIADIRVAMVTTVEKDGSLRARPMSAMFLEGDRDHLYFLTGIESHKTEEAMHDPRVNLTFAKGGDYVSVSGRATVSRNRDLIESLWSEAHRSWFPKGVKDPEICVFKVALDYAEYWDPPSATVSIAYGWTKAMLTGKSADGDLGDNEKIGRVGASA